MLVTDIGCVALTGCKFENGMCNTNPAYQGGGSNNYPGGGSGNYPGGGSMGGANCGGLIQTECDSTPGSSSCAFLRWPAAVRVAGSTMAVTLGLLSAGLGIRVFLTCGACSATFQFSAPAAPFSPFPTPLAIFVPVGSFVVCLEGSELN